MQTPSASATTGHAKPSVIVERPAPGLARGKYAFPAWGIAAVGALALAVVVAYFVVRWRRR
ncbi:MAG: hypothetical protein R3B13_24275 [Polyangiaceae bacterium]